MKVSFLVVQESDHGIHKQTVEFITNDIAFTYDTYSFLSGHILILVLFSGKFVCRYSDSSLCYIIYILFTTINELDTSLTLILIF